MFTESDQLQQFFSNQIIDHSKRIDNKYTSINVQRSSSKRGKQNSNNIEQYLQDENTNPQNYQQFAQFSNQKNGLEIYEDFEKRQKMSDFTFKKEILKKDENLSNNSCVDTEDLQSFDMLDGFFEHVQLKEDKKQNQQEIQQENKAKNQLLKQIKIETQTFSSSFISKEFQLSKTPDLNADQNLYLQDLSLNLPLESQFQSSNVFNESFNSNPNTQYQQIQSDIIFQECNKIDQIYDNLFNEIKSQDFYLQNKSQDYQQICFSQDNNISRNSKLLQSLYKINQDNNSVFYDYCSQHIDIIQSLQVPNISYILCSQTEPLKDQESIQEQSFVENKTKSLYINQGSQIFAQNSVETF